MVEAKCIIQDNETVGDASAVIGQYSKTTLNQGEYLLLLSLHYY